MHLHRGKLKALAITGTGVLAIAAAVSLGSGALSAAEAEDLTLGATGSQLNQSGASTDVDISFDGDRTLKVVVHGEGFAPGQPHAQHLHIGGNNVCPTASADEDGDSLVDTVEGQPFYGSIKVSLTVTGDTSASSGLAVSRFPVANSNGTFTYLRSFDLPAGVNASDVQKAVYVAHGVDLNGSGAYDGAARSPLDPTLPLEATIPAVCGALHVESAGNGNADVDTYTFAVPSLNGSGASANASVLLQGDMATVNIEGVGFAPNQPHAQHFHIGGQNFCPPASADSNGDGLVTTADGVPFYGGVKVSLTTVGDVSADSGLAVDRFPVADANGRVSYSRSFELPAGVTHADVANGAVLVMHGIDLNGSGMYDGSKPSSLDPNLPLEATIPAACNALTGNGAGMGGNNGGNQGNNGDNGGGGTIRPPNTGDAGLMSGSTNGGLVMLGGLVIALSSALLSVPSLKARR